MCTWIKTLHHDVQATIAIMTTFFVGLSGTITGVMLFSRMLFGPCP